jgi:Ca2+/Na+ antiporter
MNIAKNKKIILILILLLLAFFGYWFFFLSKKDAQDSINQSNNQTNKNVKTETASSNTQYDKDFVTSLVGLNSVDLNISILSSKTYKAMNYPEKPFVVNYSMDAGRDNPFLPIGSDSSIGQGVRIQDREIVNVSTTTASSTIVATTTKPILKKF